MSTEPFHFPRRERLGIIVWTLIALLIWWLPQWYPEPELDYEFLPLAAPLDSAAATAALGLLAEAGGASTALRPFDPNTVTQAELEAFGLPERAARGWVNYRRAADGYADLAALRRVRSIPAEELARLEPYLQFGPSESPTAADYSAQAETDGEREPNYFTFDPNVVTEAELRQLGLSEREARGLLNYRGSGAVFREGEDWLRIRSVATEKLESLLPYLTFETASARPTADSDRPTAYAYTPREILPININRSEMADWQQLPGVGEYWSGRILAFRRALGGFVSVAQVAETRGLPDSVYQRISTYLQPGELLAPIPINRISEEELARHPYISRRQATVLIAFRTQRRRLTAEDFAAFKGMPVADRERILPYLSF
jgi:DNA uptake protein ComE-like DNA-binding protein